MIIVNQATWGASQSNLTEYQGLVNGGIMEGIIGFSWSPESWGGFNATLAWYRKTLAATAAPKLVIFQQTGPANDYRGMRYGLATALMDDGYYEYDQLIAAEGRADYHTVMWFDEYDAQLGQPTSAPPTSPWQNGVYRRDYQNGIALVNPKGNGARTVTLESGFKHLLGTQAPSVNNGQAASSVNLADRDGIILLRTNAPSGGGTRTAARPTPPQAVTVQ